MRRCLRSVWENLYLNTVAGGVIGTSLLLLGVYISISLNLGSTIDTWNKDVHVSAYFDTTTDGILSTEERLEYRDKIQAKDAVMHVRYVSEEEATAWMMEQMPSIKPSLTVLGPSALPASLEVTLDPSVADPQFIESFVEKINDEEVFSNIDYGVEWVEKFNAFFQLLNMLGSLLGILILLAAMFLVTNTVHLVVYNRKHELEIAKLVGASNSFIVWPFIFEGAIQGVTGGLAAIAGLWVIHQTIATRLQEALGIKTTNELAFLEGKYLLVLIAVGVLLGIVSAFIATQRFLRQTR